MSQWYVNPVGSYLVATAIAVGLLIALALVALPLSDKLTRGRRRVLVSLRLAVLIMLALALFRPALVHTQTRKQTATLVLLVDRSRSMSVADAFGGKTRWEALRSTLADALPTLRDLRDNLEIKVYAFDADLYSVDFTKDIDLEAQPQGAESAIGAALEEVLRRESNKRLAGVVLLSDGAQRAYAPRDMAPQTPARRLADLGCPLYTLTLGQSRGLGQARDVSLKDLIVNQTVYVKNQLAISGTARLDGYANQKIPLQLLFESPSGKMEIVGSREIVATQDGQSIPNELSYIPTTPGEHKVTLRIAPQNGELVTTNNELSTFVTVLTGGLNVLYLEGDLRVEQKFLRRSLDASPDIRVDYLRIVARSPAERSFNLLAQFQKGKYDVYMIGDIDSQAFSQAELQALAKVVQDGAGLIMLGGYHTFAPGGYNDTPLAEVLPIEMNRHDRQNFDEPIRADVHIPGPITMQPARPMGLRHYALSLDSPSENLNTWRKLPPLDGANKFEVVKRNAHIIAETPNHQPLIVTSESGGRVMAFAADSTWHWWMHGFESAHKRFWRQVVLWLARKDDAGDGAVWVRLTQRRFAPGSRIEFEVGARDPHGEPLSDVTYQVEITGPDGAKHPVRVARQGDQNIGSFVQGAVAGDYLLQVLATQKGVAIGNAKARFLVYQQDLELDNAAADPTLLASLSKMTDQAGGQSLAPEELPDLLKRIQQQPLDLDVHTEVRSTPWDTWPFFLLFVGMLCTEWYLRKKWGLV